jgi:hypothetical protein
MTYFRELPDIQYQNFLTDSNSSQSYLQMKNIFLRGKLRDDLQNNFTVFTKYAIAERERPDQIAEKLYGDPGLDWIVITAANITNYQNDLPLTNQQLYDNIESKYGTGKNDIRFYRTTEVKDTNGRLILSAGINVDENYTIPNPDLPGSTLNPVEAISNFEYETELNDKKKTIYVLRPEYVNQYIRDMRDLAAYGINSQFLTPSTIRTENTRNQSP